MRELVFKYDKSTGEFDLSILNWDFETDDGLESAILISLFSEARVGVDELREGETELKGFWADQIVPSEERSTGSKLWLLDRGKATDEALEQARDYCIEALQWLVDDGIASSVDAEATYLARRRDTMQIEIQITRPDSSELNFKFDYVWGGRTNALRTA